MMRFKKGQRVRMTPQALRQGLGGRAKRIRGEVRGTVTGYEGGLSVRVRRDGLKTANSYYVGFWEAL
jgi:hypothetical protein